MLYSPHHMAVHCHLCHMALWQQMFHHFQKFYLPKASLMCKGDFGAQHMFWPLFIILVIILMFIAVVNQRSYQVSWALDVFLHGFKSVVYIAWNLSSCCLFWFFSCWASAVVISITFIFNVTLNRIYSDTENRIQN